MTETPKHCDTLIHAGWVITVDPERRVLADHSIALQDERIAAVLPTAEARQQFQARTVRHLPDHVIMPGLINMHGHAAMSLFRGLADDLPLKTWLEGHIWPAEGEWVGPEFVRDGTELALAEMIRCGTTFYSDNYFFPEATLDVVRQSGLRKQECFPILDFPTNWGQGPEDYLRQGLDLARQLRADPKIMVSLGPHAPYTVSDGPFRDIVAAAQEHDLLIQMHTHETPDEVEDSLRDRGQRPVARLAELGLLGPHMQCVHMTALDDADIRMIAASGTTVVHCPESNLKLASGFCPVDQLDRAGINLTLGTDGAASNNDLDMLSEMRTAAQLAKAVSGNAQALPAQAAIDMATINAARALRLDDHLGSLEAGKLADLIAIDFSEIEAFPVFDPVSHIAYATSRHQVSDMWISGNPVMASREVLTLDLDAIRQRTRRWQERLGARP